jgi:hypothetical protein
MKTRYCVSSLVLAPGVLAIALLGGCSASDNGPNNNAGSSGSTGTGGTTGVGGSGVGTGGSGPGVGGSSGGGLAIADIIDDFEDGDARIRNVTGQDGYWYAYNDHSCTVQVPAPMTEFQVGGVVPGGANASLFAGKTSGNGCSVWGAGVGVGLNTPGAVGDAAAPAPMLFNASAYTCIIFTAKSTNGNSVQVKLGTPSTISNAEPLGECPGPDTMCDNDYGRLITLTQDFAQHTVLFSDMHQDAYGLMNAPGLNTELSRIVHLQFQFNQGTNPVFDMTFDNVGFGTGCTATQ